MADPIDPDVIRAMRRFRTLLDQRETATMMEMAQHWARLERGITGHLDALVAEIAERQARGQIVTADMIRLSKRYQELQAQVRDQVAEYADWAAGKVTAEQRWMSKTALDHAAAMLRAGFPRGAFNVLPVEALKLMAGYVADGSPLRAYFTKMYPAAMQGIMDALMTGLARGWGPGKTARLMRDALGVAPRTAINSARTETLRMYREASLQQYRASGIVDGYIRVAAKSERTCMACLAKDGEWFPLTTTFEEHNQGRCRPIPAQQGQKYPGTQGLDWFTKQPEERQRMMLGPGRYEAWKANKFDLKDIAKLHKDPTWGNAWQERGLNDLLQGGGATGKLPIPPAGPGPILDLNSSAARAQAAGYRTGPEARAELAKLSDVKRSIDNLDQRMADYQKIIIESDVKLTRMSFAGGPVDPNEKRSLEDAITMFGRTLSDMKTQREQLLETFQKQSSAVVDVHEPNWLGVGVKKSKAALASAWQDGLDRFRRLVDGQAYDGMDAFVTFKGNKGRAYYDIATGVVHVDGRRGTIVHELGHWLEGQSGHIHEEALKFLDRRTQGEQLRWMGSGYGKTELTRPDKFMHPYIGKDYKGKASEVISMGLQYMSEDPVAFALADPDMFDFIYYLMRGLI